MIPNLSIIGNVSKSTGILLLTGENDTQTPVEQAFLLRQRLTDVNHPDHTLITYPNLGHAFYPSSQWATGIGPIQQYVLADLYSWLRNPIQDLQIMLLSRWLLLPHRLQTLLLNRIIQKILRVRILIVLAFILTGDKNIITTKRGFFFQRPRIVGERNFPPCPSLFLLAVL